MFNYFKRRIKNKLVSTMLKKKALYLLLAFIIMNIKIGIALFILYLLYVYRWKISQLLTMMSKKLSPKPWRKQC